MYSPSPIRQNMAAKCFVTKKEDFVHVLVISVCNLNSDWLVIQGCIAYKVFCLRRIWRGKKPESFGTRGDFQWNELGIQELNTINLINLLLQFQAWFQMHFSESV